MEFINKSYEELEETNRHQAELLKNIQNFTTKCVREIVEESKKMENSICAYFSGQLAEMIDERIGEDIEIPSISFSIHSP